MLSSNLTRWERALLACRTLILHSFVVWTAILATLSGIPMLVGEAPESMREALPPALVIVWGVEFVVGGALVVLGLFAKKPRLERIGLGYGLGPASAAYGIAVLAFGGTNAVTAAALSLGFGIACGFRLLQPSLLLAMRHDVNAAIARAEEAE